MRSGRPFGDADTEDGWDATDAVADLLDNIAHRLQALFSARAVHPSADRAARIDRIFEDLAFIRDRIVRRDL